jgi:hypothetical protein
MIITSDGRCKRNHENKTFRSRSVVKQKGMVFGFRKTATAVTRPEREIITSAPAILLWPFYETCPHNILTDILFKKPPPYYYTFSLLKYPHNISTIISLQIPPKYYYSQYITSTPTVLLWPLRSKYTCIIFLGFTPYCRHNTAFNIPGAG